MQAAEARAPTGCRLFSEVSRSGANPDPVAEVRTLAPVYQCFSILMFIVVITHHASDRLLQHFNAALQCMAYLCCLYERLFSHVRVARERELSRPGGMRRLAWARQACTFSTRAAKRSSLRRSRMVRIIIRYMRGLSTPLLHQSDTPLLPAAVQPLIDAAAAAHRCG